MKHISISRELLERIVGKCKLSVLGNDHAKVWELLNAPAVEVEGLAAEGYFFQHEETGQVMHVDAQQVEWGFEKNNPRLIKMDALCSLPKAQAIIDQQAARIAELQKDADRYRWLEANSTYGIDYRQRPELTLPIYAPDHREGLDAAIDAAMKGEGDE